MAGESPPHCAHCPHCPKKQKGWLPGVSLPGSEPCGPCRTVITDPRLEHHGAHNLAGAGLLFTSSLPIQEGTEVSAADFSFWEAGVWKDREANQAQKVCLVNS